MGQTLQLEYLSVCSGIEAASIAWEPLGFKPAGFAEIEPFPSSVLAHHWPAVPNYGDMLKLPELVANGTAPAPDILVGGTPCQAFSVAGLRGGLSDVRGALTLSFVRLANAIDDARSIRNTPPCIVVWENVPGVLSSKDNAFGFFLAGLAGEDDQLQPPGKRWANTGVVLGPQRSIAWRTLDAQYFGLAQRRRRVFVIASARNGFDPCEVLFEREGVRRDSPPSRETGQEVAGNAGSGAAHGSRHNSHWNGGPHPPLSQASQTRGGSIGASNQELFEQGGAGLVHVVACIDANYGKLQGCSGQDANHGHSHLVPVAFGQNRQSGPVDVAHALSGHAGPHGRLDFETETFLVQAVTGDITHALNTANNGKHSREDGTGRGVPVIAFHENQRAEITTSDTAGSLKAGGGKPGQGYPAVQQGMLVRRLMPHECERLQGFNDNHTLIPLKRTIRKQRKNEPDSAYADYLSRRPLAKDGPRYKAIGNSMAVPCMRWIGRRIKQQLQGVH